MKKQAPTPFPPRERARVLRTARERGSIAWPELDRLLLDACETAPRMTALLRSLRGVCIVDDGDEIFRHRLDLGFPVEGGRDAFARYSELVRSLPRMTRQEEYALARRLEFARARLEQEAGRADIPKDLREALFTGASCSALDKALEGKRPVRSDRLVSLPCRNIGSPVQVACFDYNRLRGHFVERNLHLVVSMAFNYRTYHIPMMDLVQEGNSSLIRAVEKFDWRKDVRFQTYAAFWLRQAIERMITANRGIVRVPNYIQQKMRRLRREGKLPRNQREMDVNEVQKHFGTSPEGARRLIETDRGVYSLDAPLGDEDSSFAAMLAAEESISEEMSAAEQLALSKRLDGVLGENLTRQERDIIRLRFGLGGAKPQTLDQIGERMSVSRERIRQMQVKALDKLQKPRLLEELKDFL
ncbi:MAG: sigma-70 family RNA polymerase sigma factor [Planctomycetota bacterium]|jgi:RNA polymerase primary sigma factor